MDANTLNRSYDTVDEDGHDKVDEDIDISNPVRVEWAMVTRWQPDRDTHIFPNQKGSASSFTIRR